VYGRESRVSLENKKKTGRRKRRKKGKKDRDGMIGVIYVRGWKLAV